MQVIWRRLKRRSAVRRSPLPETNLTLHRLDDCVFASAVYSEGLREIVTAVFELGDTLGVTPAASGTRTLKFEWPTVPRIFRGKILPLIVSEFRSLPGGKI